MDAQDRQVAQSPNGSKESETSLGKSLDKLPAKSPEVLERPVRRRFDAAYKVRILAEADRLQATGQVGSLLRREGLYASHLATWRKLRDAGGLDRLTPKKRGRKPLANVAERQELERLRRENARLAHRLKQAETIIEFQKKVAEMLSYPMEPPTDGSNA